MQEQSTGRAALWMAGWLSATLGMTVAGRELGHDVPVFVLMMFRSLFATAMLAPLVLWQGDIGLRFTRFPLHVMRNLVHYGAQYAWFSALLLIPMAQVIAIEFTLPIWVALLAAAFLGEHLTKRKVIAIALGFAGILTIVRPGGAALDGGHLWAISAALGFSVSVTLTKYITRTDSALTVIFMMFAIQSVIGAIPAYIYWDWPEPQNWKWVVVVGIAGTFSHYCLSKAISLADASIVMPMDFLRVPLSALLGWLVYTESIDLATAAGAALILAANSLNLFKARPSSGT
jgi:drug/metabolite transporter (DMT)-like permease